MSDGLLNGRIAIVTGGGRGIGAAIAELFASEGATVVVHYNTSREAAEILASRIGRGAIAVPADLTKPEEAQNLIDAAITSFGRIEVLVNCAASYASGISLEDATWEEYRKEFDGVVGATVNTVRAAIPHMKEARFGRIVNFIATLVQRPAVEHIVHTTAKSALIGYTRTLARDAGPYGITANMISPGMTMTEASAKLPEQTRERVRLQTPLRTLAEPIDVARVVLFYASDLAGNVTGANIAPDGGLAVL